MGHKREIRVELEVVTPMFLGGADQQAELRAPSFRGALRYWWRVWYLSSKGRALRSLDGKSDPVLKRLKGREAEIFGDTGSASPLIVRIDGMSRTKRLEIPEGQAGLNYMLYGMEDHRKRRGRETVLIYRHSVRPGERFSIVMGLRPGIGDREDVLREAAAALWLMLNLGGIGSRARRGAGSLRAVSADGWPDDMPDPVISASSTNELKKLILSGFEALGLPGRGPTGLTPIIAKGKVVIVITRKTWDSWNDALNGMGKVFRKFRNRYEPDYSLVKGVLKGQRASGTVERAAFGLPLPFYFRSLGGAKLTVTGELGGRGFTRAASPLIFHVTKLANRGYLFVISAFAHHLLPRGAKLRLNNEYVAVPPNKILTKFMSHLGHDNIVQVV